MGQENLAGMMLLGIGAAVRRGLTVVIYEGDIVDWNNQPFNLKEIHVLPIKIGEASAHVLANFIVDGWSALDAVPPDIGTCPSLRSFDGLVGEPGNRSSGQKHSCCVRSAKTTTGTVFSCFLVQSMFKAAARFRRSGS